MPGARSGIYVPRHSYYESDYGIDDSIHRAEYFSNAVLEDNFDAAARSRGRDYALLRDANSIMDGFYYAPEYSTTCLTASRPPLPPRYSVGGRRVLFQRPIRPRLHLPPMYEYIPYVPYAGRAISEPRILHVPPVSIPDPKENNQEDSESDKNNGPSGIPNYYSVGGDPSNLPVSELRRKLRRTICKAKNNPNYYRETLDD